MRSHWFGAVAALSCLAAPCLAGRGQESSRDYDPGPALGSIKAPLLAINTADDLINPPDLGILEREIKRVAHGRAITLPVVTGEELYTKAEFREVFEKQAADILNPDVCNCGGILELKEIAAMAEPYFVAMAPHNYNSTTIGLAATIQLCATIPNFLITEYFVNFTERGDEISKNPIRVENGCIPLPSAPGLGLELDEAAMARYPYREHPKRSLRQFYDEGP